MWESPAIVAGLFVFAVGLFEFCLYSREWDESQKRQCCIFLQSSVCTVNIPGGRAIGGRLVFSCLRQPIAASVELMEKHTACLPVFAPANRGSPALSGRGLESCDPVQ